MEPQISDISDEKIDFDQLKQELDEALLKAEDNLAGWKRAQADLENYRKRKETENAELLEFGKQVAFVKILPTLDSLEQALIQAPEVNDEKYQNWKKGLEGIVKQITEALQGIGIKKIEAVGQKFDPNLHEAVKEMPGDEDGIVLEQYQTGYLLNDKLLRPAQVVLSKKQNSN